VIINGDILAQFGVRGMKWGVRKPTTRGSTPPSKRAPKEGGEKRQSLDMHSMSDTELRNAINRIKMQKEYAQLTAPPPKEKGRGRQLVENIVFSSAEAAGKKVLTGALTNVLENALPPALRGKPEKSKADQVAEKVLKGLKGDKKADEGGDEPSSPEKPKPKPGPQKPSPGSGPLPAPPSPAPSGGGARQAPPRHSSGSRPSNPFRRSGGSAKKSSPPTVDVPDATVRPKPSGPAPVAAIPSKPSTQGRPGHSGSGRSYNNDSSSTDRKGGGATQGRPGTTGKRKRRKWPFGHGDLDGIVVDILGEMD
jgi:hypothetical protein